jgi:hypothetical protein
VKKSINSIKKKKLGNREIRIILISIKTVSYKETVNKIALWNCMSRIIFADRKDRCSRVYAAKRRSLIVTASYQITA